MVVPAAEENEKPDPIPGYECHITANPVERNSAVEKKIRRSQVNTRTTFLVFMEYSYESCAILSAMADPGFPRRGGGGEGRQSLRLGQKPIIWQYFAENCIVVLIVQTLALSITKSRPKCIKLCTGTHENIFAFLFM